MIDISSFEKTKKISISFSLDQELNKFLEEHAKVLKINKSQIVQYLVRDLYESVKAAKAGKKTGEIEAAKWLNEKTQGGKDYE